jgi:hypothetical protein
MAIEFHRNGPWELSEGWVWARASDFARVVGGGTPKNARGQIAFSQGFGKLFSQTIASGLITNLIARTCWLLRRRLE